MMFPSTSDMTVAFMSCMCIIKVFVLGITICGQKKYDKTYYCLYCHTPSLRCRDISNVNTIRKMKGKR